MGDSPDADRPPEPHPARPPGRLASAWQVLQGRALVPDQIRWEWAEYQHQFNDLLQRYSATLARAAKAEKKRLSSLHDVLDQSQEPSSRPQFASHKDELRHRAAQYRGLSLSPRSSPERAPLPPEESP